MLTLIRIIVGIGYVIFWGMSVMIALFFLLCMNVFTIPLFLVLYLPCKLFKFNTPKARLYGLMIYPSWSQEKCFTFMGTLEKLAERSKRKSEEKIRRTRVFFHPWEGRFFY